MFKIYEHFINYKTAQAEQMTEHRDTLMQSKKHTQQGWGEHSNNDNTQ